MRSSEFGLQFHRAPEHCFGLDEARFAEPPEVPKPALVTVPSIEVPCRPSYRGLALDPGQLRLDHRGNLLRHRVLHLKDVGQSNLVRVRPQMPAGLAANQI